MNRPRWNPGAFGAALMLLVSGCATTPDDPPIEASVTDLRFTGATLFETVAVVEVRLDNVSPRDLRVTGATHRLKVNGLNLGKGLTGEMLTLPRLGSAVQQVEFHLRNLSLARTLHDLAQTRLLDYQLESTLYVAREGGTDRTQRLRKSGQLDLNQIAPTTAPP